MKNQSDVFKDHVKDIEKLKVKYNLDSCQILILQLVSAFVLLPCRDFERGWFER